MGDPREPTDPAILQALRDGVRERMGYPAALGLPELARRSRLGRPTLRRDARPDRTGDPDARVEGGDLLLCAGRPRSRPPVATPSSSPSPAIPVPGRGAPFAGARVVSLPLLEGERVLPDLDLVADGSGADRRPLAQLPNNPTGRRMLSFSRAPPSSPASAASCLPPTRRTGSSGSTSPPLSALQLARPHRRRWRSTPSRRGRR